LRLVEENTEFIQKPLHPEQLAIMVQKRLDREDGEC
jgi:hypothetical protein